MPILSAFAGMAFAGSLGMLQDWVWVERRTTGGCTYRSLQLPGQDEPGAITWSGACTPGRPISGTGVLEEKWEWDGEVSLERFTGTLSDGYWQGSVRREAFYSVGGGPLEPDFSFEITYDMGCGEEWESCPPRPSQTAEPQGQRIYDTAEDYAASQQRAQAATGGPGGGSGPGAAHNTDNDAVACLELLTLNGAGSLRNNCAFTVEAVWCVENHDCNPSYSNMWSIGAGRLYPVFGSRDGGQIHWGACRGANSIRLYRQDPVFHYRCPDDLQPRR